MKVLKDLFVVVVALVLAVSVQGLEFRPMPPSLCNSTLISYNASDEANVAYWTNDIDDFLKLYLENDSNVTGADNRVACDYERPPPAGKVCNVPVDTWIPCTWKNNYNYHKSAPCIFLKWNDIYNWKPATYNNTDALPSKMPEDLKAYINNKKYHPEIPFVQNTVWVSCEGETPADHENMGSIMHIPTRGFPSYYFPFTNTDGYLSPLMAIFFERPRRGVVISIVCKAWAKNIKHDQHDSRGSVHFKLMID